jgi:hypothetical protein
MAVNVALHTHCDLNQLVDWLTQHVGTENTPDLTAIRHGQGWRIYTDWTENFYVTGPIQLAGWHTRNWVQITAEIPDSLHTEFLLRWS